MRAPTKCRSERGGGEEKSGWPCERTASRRRDAGRGAEGRNAKRSIVMSRNIVRVLKRIRRSFRWQLADACFSRARENTRPKDSAAAGAREHKRLIYYLITRLPDDTYRAIHAHTYTRTRTRVREDARREELGAMSVAKGACEGIARLAISSVENETSISHRTAYRYRASIAIRTKIIRVTVKEGVER